MPMLDRRGRLPTPQSALGIDDPATRLPGAPSGERRGCATRPEGPVSDFRNRYHTTWRPRPRHAKLPIPREVAAYLCGLANGRPRTRQDTPSRANALMLQVRTRRRGVATLPHAGPRPVQADARHAARPLGAQSSGPRSVRPATPSTGSDLTRHRTSREELWRLWTCPE